MQNFMNAGNSETDFVLNILYLKKKNAHTSRMCLHSKSEQFIRTRKEIIMRNSLTATKL